MCRHKVMEVVWVFTFFMGGVVEIEAIKADTSVVESLLADMKSNRAAYTTREIRPPVWPS